MINNLTKNKLKIVAVLLLASFFINTNTHAQDTGGDVYKNAVTFGIAHSIQFTTITGTFPGNIKGNLESKTFVTAPRVTSNFGMTLDYYFNKKFSLQFDFLYTYMGAHLSQKTLVYNEVGVIPNNRYFTYAATYFKFPLTLNFYPNKFLYVNGGGYFAPKLMSSKYNKWYNSRTNPIENIKPIDYGFVAGFGFNLKYVKLGFQYSYGIGSFIDDSKFDIHHNVFEFTVRWKFYSDIRKRS